ncbi:hypothetical protein JANAI62_10990 [Jannaschia pagri]|uniref:Uncharacterized protein n=1 Tax=Jannaschia pagri TaxID=2829797 RepID=A0ABQ4NJ86_9RHOB|nr:MULTISPECIES: DUF1826 domain-containing protein [unclassified Jannaschia]GIT90644.1 hypothetical protein JANAI61_11020 [Jannaschia sp. AI_61]GIT94476.1 hypothetical protein JANAI62_10990 [Jannaschia sp. AI_62]
MTIVETLSPVTGGLARAERPEDLAAFLQPSCAAAIWTRDVDPAFQTWIDGLDPSHLPQGRVVSAPDRAREVVAGLCDVCETPAGPHRDRLVDDIAALAHIFADLMQAPYLRIRLQAVRTNACRRFHVDAIPARLVCTYRGEGTQYGKRLAQDEDPHHVFSAPTGAPILLRGVPLARNAQRRSAAPLSPD